MNTSPKLIKGLGACLLQKGTFQSLAAQPAVRPSRSSALPGRWEPLGAPSHAGVPDDSAVFCGESIWAGESGLARQQVGFGAFSLISRGVLLRGQCRIQAQLLL